MPAALVVLTAADQQALLRADEEPCLAFVEPLLADVDLQVPNVAKR